MDTSALKNFAQESRRYLLDVVSKKIEFYLTTDSVEIRARAKEIEELKEEIQKTSKQQVIDKVAYTWFNRFCALRFMDVNQFTPIGIISPIEGHTQPEILQEAKSGHIRDEFGSLTSRLSVVDLLVGKVSSSDPQAEAYRQLLVMACNYYHSTMPFLFEKIDHFTELLLPDDLLSENSILSSVRNTLTKENCKDVEIIGWLYQFYISEKKDEVFRGLKNNKKISPENIPAATQLFTPNWIVRYLVENSLGRLWMLNRPNSKVIDKMAYYIRPEHIETDFLKVSSVEEIKVCDPACGSAHMLVYAFDLLYLIYEEEGFQPTEIPNKILTNNLFGIEIDERAGELAAFALVMKARTKYRRFLSNPVQPNICILKNYKFDERELKDYVDFVGRDLITSTLQDTLQQFEEADNFGSLIRPLINDVNIIVKHLETKNVSGHLFLALTHQHVLEVLKQCDYLSSKYHVVIANPPYMGGKGMNENLKGFLNNNYPDVKSDLFSAFIVRNTVLALPSGQLGFMTPFVWMFISTYKKLRNYILDSKAITSLIQLEYSGFDGATVPICTFTLENQHKPEYKGGYVRLSNFRGSENQAPNVLIAIQNPNCGWFHRASSIDFKKIPGSSIAFWLSQASRAIFEHGSCLKDSMNIKQGMATSNNNRFLRSWFEVSNFNIAFNCNSLEESETRPEKWYPYNKGGNFRKWYGNNEHVVNWQSNGYELREFIEELNKLRPGGRLKNQEYYFKPSITWTDISSSYFGVRYSKPGFIFDASGSSAFPDENELEFYTAYLCTKMVYQFLQGINPTLHFQVENIAALPILKEKNLIIAADVMSISKKCIEISEMDWNSYELSWDFTFFPILSTDLDRQSLSSAYFSLREKWLKLTLEMQTLEEENNRIFLKAYCLDEEIAPNVALSEITLTCNPYYRFSSDKNTEEVEKLLLKETIKEFISYAVGCMFGRYSIEKPGLILAAQGQGLKEYLSHIPNPKFMPDNDNIIPLIEGDWFRDEVVEKFSAFLKVTFGVAKYEENLRFVEDSLGLDIRNYFLKDFYNDHVRRFKKRPIYWQFSSPKGSFNVLIYIHRYRPDTVSSILNDYLREFRNKLNAKKEHLERLNISEATLSKDKTSAIKEIEKLKKIIVELDEYEHNVIYPLASQKMEINLDDGVKVNYLKFGAALKPIKGLDKDEE